jgi:hypothetical protein
MSNRRASSLSPVSSSRRQQLPSNMCGVSIRQVVRVETDPACVHITAKNKQSRRGANDGNDVAAPRTRNHLRRYHSLAVPRPSIDRPVRHVSDSSPPPLSPISSFLSHLQKSKSASSMEIVPDDLVSHRSVSDPSLLQVSLSERRLATGAMMMVDKKNRRWEQDSSRKTFVSRGEEGGEMMMMMTTMSTPFLFASDSPVMCPKRRKSVEDYGSDSPHQETCTISTVIDTHAESVKDNDSTVATLKLAIAEIQNQLQILYPNHIVDSDDEMDDEDRSYNAKVVANHIASVGSSMKGHYAMTGQGRAPSAPRLPNLPSLVNLLSSPRPAMKKSSIVDAKNGFRPYRQHCDVLVQQRNMIPQERQQPCPLITHSNPSEEQYSASSSSSVSSTVQPRFDSSSSSAIPDYGMALEAIQERYASYTA